MIQTSDLCFQCCTTFAMTTTRPRYHYQHCRLLLYFSHHLQESPYSLNKAAGSSGGLSNKRRNYSSLITSTILHFTSFTSFASEVISRLWSWESAPWHSKRTVSEAERYDGSNYKQWLPRKDKRECYFCVLYLHITSIKLFVCFVSRLNSEWNISFSLHACLLHISCRYITLGDHRTTLVRSVLKRSSQ